MRVRVGLGERSYDVVIEGGSRHDLADTLAAVCPDARHAAVVTTDAIARQPWFDLDPGIASTRVLVPDGEDAKRFSVLADVCEQFARMGLSRRDVVVAVGGGAVTDLAGFAAASYQRGVDVVHVATSLVAQVDAAIGGKTGIDLEAGKNLVGAFHQPRAVLCDPDVLATLPARERASGYGEIAKCLLLEGRDVPAAVDDEDLIVAAVTLKVAFVEADERDGGRRALLNYGHTLGHAIEAEQWRTGRGDLRHGEAVAIGIAFAARLARRLGRVGDEVVAHHDAMLDAFSLPRRLAGEHAPDDLLAAIGRDKKAHHNLTFVLAGTEGFGVVADLDADVVRDELGRFATEVA